MPTLYSTSLNVFDKHWKRLRGWKIFETHWDKWTAHYIPKRYNILLETELKRYLLHLFSVNNYLRYSHKCLTGVDNVWHVVNKCWSLYSICWLCLILNIRTWYFFSFQFSYWTSKSCFYLSVSTDNTHIRSISGSDTNPWISAPFMLWSFLSCIMERAFVC